ncbi:MAG: cytochrome c family protein [Acidobacteriota bacterium]|nr:cytochrome c family protein [Acidobacteriota bacterium]
MVFRLMRGTAFVVISLHAEAIVQYAGSAACASCHPAESFHQLASAHAGALFRATDHPALKALPRELKLVRPPTYRFQFSRSSTAMKVRIQDSTGAMDLPLEWAFGAGRQAITFVTRVNKDWYVEHYGSFYPALRAYAATPGQSAIQPTSLPEAAGVIYKIKDPATGIAGCFECHSTGPVWFDPDGEVHLTEPGVHCESCHGPGEAHVKSPTRHRPEDPGKFSAVRLNDFCGKCHRPPAAKGVTIDWNYAWNVRHQPVYLSESPCFKKSGGALSCLTCHDAHESAGKKPVAYYNAKCSVCHAEGNRPPNRVCLKRQPANCIDCHMPLVSPQPPLRFTNHWIGIYAAGAKLKPVSRR